MRTPFPASLCLALLLISCFLIGCLKSNPTNPSEQVSGSVSFRIAVTSHPFRSIAKSASIKISAVDMKDISKPLIITDSSVTGEIQNVPAGKSRNFDVVVLDSTGTPVYRGFAIADIKPDTSNPISMTD